MIPPGRFKLTKKAKGKSFAFFKQAHLLSFEPLIVEESRRTEEFWNKKGFKDEPFLREEKVIVNEEKIVIDKKDPFFVFFYPFIIEFLEFKLFFFFPRINRVDEGKSEKEGYHQTQ
jgi:hypothetical protein